MSRSSAITILVAFLTGVFASSVKADAPEEILWKPFSIEKLEKLEKEGKSVIVFTAAEHELDDHMARLKKGCLANDKVREYIGSAFVPLLLSFDGKNFPIKDKNVAYLEKRQGTIVKESIKSKPDSRKYEWSDLILFFPNAPSYRISSWKSPDRFLLFPPADNEFERLSQRILRFNSMPIGCELYPDRGRLQVLGFGFIPADKQEKGGIKELIKVVGKGDREGKSAEEISRIKTAVESIVYSQECPTTLLSSPKKNANLNYFGRFKIRPARAAEAKHRTVVKKDFQDWFLRHFDTPQKEKKFFDKNIDNEENEIEPTHKNYANFEAYYTDHQGADNFKELQAHSKHVRKVASMLEKEVFKNTDKLLIFEPDRGSRDYFFLILGVNENGVFYIIMDGYSLG